MGSVFHVKPSAATLLPLLLLALLAGVTFWLEQTTRTDTGRDGKTRHDPDFIVEDFQVRRYDIEGRLQHTLVAKKMTHYADDESSDVLTPHLTYHRETPTVVTSRTAWMDKGGDHVRLDDDVRIARAAYGVNPATVMTTMVLHVVPDDELAHTAAPVEITQGATVIRGTGLTSNNKTQISTLAGRVHGIIYRTRP